MIRNLLMASGVVFLLSSYVFASETGEARLAMVMVEELLSYNLEDLIEVETSVFVFYQTLVSTLSILPQYVSLLWRL